MRVTMDGDYSPHWQEDGSTMRTGFLTITEDGKADMRVVLAIVEEEEGTTPDVHIIAGPLGTAGLDQRTTLVLRGDAGRAFLRLAVRAFRAQKNVGKDDGE